MRRVGAVAAVVAASLAATGCGGGGGGSLPDGASIAPADAPAFISVNTDFSSTQWKNVERLAARFPGTKLLVQQFRKESGGLDLNEDVKPALGREVDIVWLDFRNDGNDVVVLTKPRDEQKLDALLKKARSEGTNAAKAKVEGWTVLAENQARIDRFKELAAGDKLDSNDEFKDTVRDLDPDSSVRAWVDGTMVQDALDRALATGGAAPRITHEVGTLRALSASATARGNGVSGEINGFIDPKPDPATFTPSLVDDVPAGALLYVSATGLDEATRLVLAMVSRSQPNFETQLRQVEGVLGVTLKDDIYPLIHGESAVAVYRGAPIPPILFLQKVPDEKKADGLVRRFSAIAQLSGDVQTRTVELEGVSMQKLTFPPNISIWDGVSKGRLVVTNSERLARQAITGPATALADEQLYRSARDAASLPNEVIAFAYADLENGLPFVFTQAERGGNAIPPEARTNTKPLHTAMAYLRREGDSLRLSEFVTIK
jgi:hypothetical protein